MQETNNKTEMRPGLSEANNKPIRRVRIMHETNNEPKIRPGLSEAEIKTNMDVASLKDYENLNGKTIFGYINDAKEEIVAPPTKDRKKGVEYNGNIAVCGSTGTQKTRSFVTNYILQAIQRGESVVVNDAKGEAFKWTSEFAKKNGYTVKVLNLVENITELMHSDGWDMLSEIRKDPQRAWIFARTVINNTGDKDSKDFRVSAEENLLMAILLLMSINKLGLTNRTGEKPTMRDVYEFTTLSDEQMKATFNTLERNFPDHPAITPFKMFWGTDRIRGQIAHSLSVRLQVFNNKQVSKVLGTDEIDLTMPGQTHCIYYLRFSDQQSNKFIAPLFFTFMYLDLKDCADTWEDHQLATKVTLLIDEFCNIGEIPEFSHRIATAWSRGINSVIVFQDISQISTVYADTWMSILGCCDTFIFLGCGICDNVTSEFVSKLSDEATIRNNGIASFKEGLTPHDVKMLDRNKEYVFFNHEDVMVLTKMDFSEHPLATEIEEINVTDHESHVSVPEVAYDCMMLPNYKNPTSDDDNPNRTRNRGYGKRKTPLIKL